MPGALCRTFVRGSKLMGKAGFGSHRDVTGGERFDRAGTVGDAQDGVRQGLSQRQASSTARVVA